jgi:hypothetical protein
MLSSTMVLLNLIPLIDVTFSTPTPVYISYHTGAFCSFNSGIQIDSGRQKDSRRTTVTDMILRNYLPSFHTYKKSVSLAVVTLRPVL